MNLKEILKLNTYWEQASVVFAVRIWHQSRVGGRVHSRNARRAIHQLEIPSVCEWFRRRVGQHQGILRDCEPMFRRHRQSDAVLESRRRHGTVSRREQNPGRENLARTSRVVVFSNLRRRVLPRLLGPTGWWFPRTVARKSLERQGYHRRSSGCTLPPVDFKQLRAELQESTAADATSPTKTPYLPQCTRKSSTNTSSLATSWVRFPCFQLKPS